MYGNIIIKRLSLAVLVLVAAERLATAQHAGYESVLSSRRDDLIPPTPTNMPATTATSPVMAMSADSNGQLAPATSVPMANDCCTTDCGPRWFGGAEYRYLRPHFSEAVAFATVTDAITPQGFRRQVAAHELDFDYDSSFRLFLGYHLNQCADVRLSYWNLDSDTLVSGTPGLGQTIVDPFGNMALAGSRIDTSASVQMNVFDLEYLRPLHFNTAGVGFLYSAGLRFADVNQFYGSTVLNAANIVTSDARFDVEFFGVGPYLSLTGETGRASGRPFSLFAKGAMALLVGQYDIATEVTLPGAFGSQTADRVRTVPVLESELGLAWRPTNAITFSAGWLFQAWFNLGASGGTFDGELLPVAPIDTAFGGADDADIMSFDGLFLRAEIGY